MPLVDDLHFLPLQRQFEQRDHAVLSELRSDGAAAHSGELLLHPLDILRGLQDANLVLTPFACTGMT
jgi:hypothetical protein